MGRPDRTNRLVEAVAGSSRPSGRRDHGFTTLCFSPAVFDIFSKCPCCRFWLDRSWQGRFVSNLTTKLGRTFEGRAFDNSPSGYHYSSSCDNRWGAVVARLLSKTCYSLVTVCCYEWVLTREQSGERLSHLEYWTLEDTGAVVTRF